MEKLARLLAETLLEQEGEDQPQTKLLLGNISEETRQAYKQMTLDKEEAEDELEIRKKQLAREAERRLKIEFGDVLGELEERHEKLWTKIFDELDVQDREANHTINTRTGQVFKKVKMPKL